MNFNRERVGDAALHLDAMPTFDLIAGTIAAVIGYLLGSLPFGYLIARAKGVNIFEVGSKRPGSTNVLRVLGKGPGYLAFFFSMR